MVAAFFLKIGLSGMGVGLDSRDLQIALADQVAPVDQERWLAIVNIVILVFTILGAGMILGSMSFLEYVRGRPGTTRTRIVQALIVSDFLLGIIGLISSCLTLTGDGSSMRAGGTACSGLGFMLTAILWTEHAWTLILAVSTYMILIYPLHWSTLWLEQRWYWLWALVWVLSIIIATIGQTVYGYFPSGGTCFYGQNTGLYSELMQFIPRAVVCLTITCLYARLYVFLRRPDKIRIPGSNSGTGEMYDTVSSGSEKSKGGDIRERFGSLIPGTFWRKRGSSGDTLTTPEDGAGKPEGAEGTQVESGRRGSKPSDVPKRELAPWERVELPPFQIGGEKFGDRPAASHSIWSGWKGMGRTRSSTASGVTANAHSGTASRMNSLSMSTTDQPTTNRSPPPNSPAPRLPSVASEDTSQYTSEAVAVAANSHQRVDTNDTLVSPWATHTPEKTRRGPSKRFSTDFQMPLSPKSFHLSSLELSPRIEKHRPSVTISEDLEYFDASRSRSESHHPQTTMPPPTISRPPSTTPSNTSTPNLSQPNNTTRTSVDSFGPQSGSRNGRSEKQLSNVSNIIRKEDEAGDEGDDEWDLIRMLAQPPPGASADDRFAPPPDTGERIEFVQESMSSYLNRKTALLMLWFPLGYIFLFSVSLIRLIYDFVGKPPTALRAASKWMVLAQGVLDAIIYGVVEWHTKRVVRKKIRRGTFSPKANNTPVGSRAGASTAGFFKNISSMVSGGGGTTSRGGVGESSATKSNPGQYAPGRGQTSSLVVQESERELGQRSNVSRRERGEVSFLEDVVEWGGSPTEKDGLGGGTRGSQAGGEGQDEGKIGATREDGAVKRGGSRSRSASRNRNADRIGSAGSTTAASGRSTEGLEIEADRESPLGRTRV